MDKFESKILKGIKSEFSRDEALVVFIKTIKELEIENGCLKSEIDELKYDNKNLTKEVKRKKVFSSSKVINDRLVCLEKKLINLHKSFELLNYEKKVIVKNITKDFSDEEKQNFHIENDVDRADFILNIYPKLSQINP